MSQAVAALRKGEEFQARLFWRKAARLLDPASPIRRVGFECGPKAFDDVWVEYEPGRGPRDHSGVELFREHVQCKWHVAPSSYGYAELVDPAFINANTRSLLERARAAQHMHAPAGIGTRFTLATNWTIDRHDPLAELVHKGSNSLRLPRLFAPSIGIRKMEAVRALWRDHLGVDDEELQRFARALGFAEVSESHDDLREHLDLLFSICGLRRIPQHESAFVYDDVVYKWLGQGRLEFDRDSFRAVCSDENLVASPAEGRPVVYGVKSFEHATDRLEDRCTKVLNLVPQFVERYIRPGADWRTTLYPALQEFLLDAARGADRLRLVLDAHATLAFAAGSVLNIKSGRSIEIEQRTLGRRVWAPDDEARDERWPTCSFATETCHPAASDIAVAVGLTHDIADDVRAYIQAQLPTVGTLLVARLATSAGARSVACGRHAFELAEAVTGAVKAARSRASAEDRSHTPGSQQAAKVHLFIAAPNAFTFYLGQRQPGMGRLTLYEYDFEQGRHGTYEPSLDLPVRTTSTNPQP